MKIFISQGMKDKSPEQIKSERKRAMEYAKSMFEDAEELDTYFKNFKPKSEEGTVGYRLEFLAKSINAMKDADLVIFLSGWENFNGCVVEHTTAVEYELPIFYC